MSPLFFEFIRPLVVWICTRLYQGIHLDEEGIAEVRQAANRGGLILCPSHKSHMDYVILTLLFYEKGLLPPHVAAGINLAFWPFGAIARWCGGFFIRRSFKGDHLYSAVVRAYVKRLMRDGFPQEFFIEGGRSRTGKLAFPKTGLLAMEVDAWREGAGEDLFFVPVAIDYEKLPEGGSYARELGGGEKKKENVWSLLEARKILRTRHGRIYVQFDRPISLAELTGGRDQPLVVGDRQGDAGPARVRAEPGQPHRLRHQPRQHHHAGRPVRGGAALGDRADHRRGARLAPRPPAPDRGRGRWAPARGARRRGARPGGGRPDRRGAGDAPARRGGRGARRRREHDLRRCRAPGAPSSTSFATMSSTTSSPWRSSPRRAACGHPRIRPARARWKPTRAGSRACSSSSSCIASARASRRSSRRRGRRWSSWRSTALPAPVRAAPNRSCPRWSSPTPTPTAVAALTLTTWPGGDRRAFVRSALQTAGEEVAAGRIEPEAASKTTLENATAWLMGEGAFESPGGEDASDGGGRLRVSAAWRESRAAALVAEIERFRPLRVSRAEPSR